MDNLFYIVSFFILSFAVMTVTLSNVLHSALALIGTLIGTAVFYLMMNAEFLAIAQILVYIGGVIIFVVFAILLTYRLNERHLPSGRVKAVSGALLSLTALGLMAPFFMKHAKSGGAVNGNIGKLTEVGFRLLSIDKAGFIIPFEVISLALLAAMIGAIVIARTDVKAKPAGPEPKAPPPGAGAEMTYARNVNAAHPGYQRGNHA